MAALRRLTRASFNMISTCSLFPPALFMSHRGIVTKLFVGGLSFHTTEDGLSEAFSQYGQVVEAKVVADRVTQRSKGFGFITFASDDEAHKALNKMNGRVLHGRAIYVDYAKPNTSFGGGMPIARGPPEPISKNEEQDDVEATPEATSKNEEPDDVEAKP